MLINFKINSILNLNSYKFFDIDVLGVKNLIEEINAVEFLMLELLLMVF